MWISRQCSSPAWHLRSKDRASSLPFSCALKTVNAYWSGLQCCHGGTDVREPPGTQETPFLEPLPCCRLLSTTTPQVVACAVPRRRQSLLFLCVPRREAAQRYRITGAPNTGSEASCASVLHREVEEGRYLRTHIVGCGLVRGLASGVKV